MLNEMEIADGDGNEDGDSMLDEEEGGLESISVDEYQGGGLRDSLPFGATMKSISASTTWNDVMRIGADINRRIETHT